MRFRPRIGGGRREPLNDAAKTEGLRVALMYARRGRRQFQVGAKDRVGGTGTGMIKYVRRADLRQRRTAIDVFHFRWPCGRLMRNAGARR